jgi:hypothetical protein
VGGWAGGRLAGVGAKQAGGRWQRELGREVCLGHEGDKVSRAWGRNGLWASGAWPG